MRSSRKKTKSLGQLREKSWRALHRERCDFCGCGLGGDRVKATHSTGLVFYLCLRCGVPVMCSVASLPVG